MNFAQFTGEVAKASRHAADEAWTSRDEWDDLDEMIDTVRELVRNQIDEKSRGAGHKAAITRSFIGTGIRAYDKRMAELRAT